MSCNQREFLQSLITKYTAVPEYNYPGASIEGVSLEEVEKAIKDLEYYHENPDKKPKPASAPVLTRYDQPNPYSVKEAYLEYPFLHPYIFLSSPQIPNSYNVNEIFFANPTPETLNLFKKRLDITEMEYYISRYLSQQDYSKESLKVAEELGLNLHDYFKANHVDLDSNIMLVKCLLTYLQPDEYGPIFLETSFCDINLCRFLREANLLHYVDPNKYIRSVTVHVNADYRYCYPTATDLVIWYIRNMSNDVNFFDLFRIKIKEPSILREFKRLQPAKYKEGMEKVATAPVFQSLVTYTTPLFAGDGIKFVTLALVETARILSKNVNQDLLDNFIINHLNEVFKGPKPPTSPFYPFSPNVNNQRDFETLIYMLSDDVRSAFLSAKREDIEIFFPDF